MSNPVDFEIYKSIKQNIRFTELFLGSVQVSWPFAKITYKADCTEAIPFSPFDKVICSLLEIEDCLSLDELAAILGFNTIDDPTSNKYKDLAEYEILLESLSSLYDFGMIEKGDSFFSKCTLTVIGKEYTEKKTKFRTTENKSFSLYFDLFSNDHSQAKSVFRDIRGVKVSEPETSVSFDEEQFIKTFSQAQIPDIYNIDKGHSFSNSSVIEKSFFAVPMFAGISYDYQNNKFNIAVFCDQTHTLYFTDTLNKNDELKDILIDNLLTKLETTEFNKSDLQIKFEDSTMLFQNDIDYLLYQNKTQDAISKINSFYDQTIYYDFVSWWFKFDHLITTDALEICLLLPEVNPFIIECLLSSTDKYKNTNFFIACTGGNDIENNLISGLIESSFERQNVFLATDVTVSEFNVMFVYSDKKFNFTFSDFIFQIEDISFTLNVLLRNNSSETLEKKYKAIKKAFCNKIITSLFDECESNLTTDVDKWSLQSIHNIESIDSRIVPFSDILTGEFKLRYDNICKLKIEKITTGKKQHQDSLLSLLNSFSNNPDIDKIENIEKVDLLFSEINAIESELLPEYTTLKGEIAKLKLRLAETKKYIKDQVLAKFYVIDTNVFIDCPEILSIIDSKHNIIISAKVIDELDKLKRKINNAEKQSNVEKSLSLINKSIGKQKNLRTAKSNLSLLPKDFNEKSPDNFILAVAIMYREKNVVLLTSDNGLQAKAKILEISTMGLKELLEVEKYKNLTSKSGLPISVKTNKPLNIIEVVKTYQSSVNPITKKITMGQLNDALIKNMKDFSYKEFGFSKFKDFCASLSDIFEIVTDEKNTVFINLKIKI